MLAAMMILLLSPPAVCFGFFHIILKHSNHACHMQRFASDLHNTEFLFIFCYVSWHFADPKMLPTSKRSVLFEVVLLLEQYFN